VDRLDFTDKTSYTEKLKKTMAKTSRKEAIWIGTGKILGRDVASVLHTFVTGMPTKFSIAKGDAVLEGLLADWGVEVNDDLVVDPSKRLPFYDLSAVYLTDFGSHPVTQGLEGVAVLFTVTRSLEPDTEAGAEIIVSTSSEGWGETNLAQLLAGDPVALDEADNQAPAVVGVVVDGSPTAESDLPEGEEADDSTAGHRLMVYGDSDFMADYEISNAGNLTLAMNSFNWLAAREQSLGIAPREVEQVNLYLSQQQMRNILLLVLLVMPGAAIILGILVWRRRRH
jgi:ABC-type uncharacterized transport system involved in gliding motility auxiliary subunit